MVKLDGCWIAHQPRHGLKYWSHDSPQSDSGSDSAVIIVAKAFAIVGGLAA